MHPPLPAVRINNNQLIWSSVSCGSRNRVDSFSSTLRRRRNMSELGRRSGIGFMRLATVQRNAHIKCSSDRFEQQLMIERFPKELHRALSLA